MFEGRVIKNISSLQSIKEQQRKQIQEFQENEDIIEKQRLKIASLEDDVNTLKKRNSEFENRNLSLTSEYYELKNYLIATETEAKKGKENCDQLKKQLKQIEETNKFWEEKAKNDENTLKKLQEEFDSCRMSSENVSLFSLQKETDYQAEISQLKNKIAKLESSVGGEVEMCMMKLKEKLQFEISERECASQELNELKEKKIL